MTATLETPVDRFSGLPLLIAPSNKGRTPESGNSSYNWHHLFHPENSPVLQETLGGIALRHCRIQLVNKYIHNHQSRGKFKGVAYHTLYTGPKIPTDEDEQFRTCVLACAGYIPEEVIDLWAGEPKQREITDKERDFLRVKDPNEPFDYLMVKYRYEPVRDFFQEYTLSQNLIDANVRESTIDKFLTTQDEKLRRYLGHFLIAKAAEAAAAKIETEYSEIRSEGKLHPLMPADPSTLIKFKIGNTAGREMLFPRLDQRLKELTQAA